MVFRCTSKHCFVKSKTYVFNVTCRSMLFKGFPMRSIFALSLLSFGLILLYYSLSSEWLTSLTPSFLQYKSKHDFESLSCIETPLWKDVDRENRIALKSFNIAMIKYDRSEVRRKQNIYFLETSCDTTVRSRVLCSFESFALHNPENDVLPLFLTNVLEDEFKIIKKLQFKYKNLKFMTFNISDWIIDSPLESFFKSKDWYSNKQWTSVHLSDSLRTALLWQVGGVYSDIDVICLRNLAALGNNTLGLETENVINSAFMKFQKKHPYLRSLLQHLVLNFDAYNWGENGPKAVTKALIKFCDINNLAEFRNTNCEGISLLNKTAFYSISWQRSKIIFEDSSSDPVYWKELNNSFVLHIWNHLTEKYKSLIGGKSIFDVAAENHCPLTYQALIDQRITSF